MKKLIQTLIPVNRVSQLWSMLSEDYEEDV